MKKLALSIIPLIISLFFSFGTYSQENEVKDKQKLSALYSELNRELQAALDQINPSGSTSKHLQEFLKLYNNGKVKTAFFSSSTLRGRKYSDEDCDCSTIFLSSDFIDSGVVSTLIHEFEHLLHDLQFDKNFFKNNPELDKLTDIFGAYYFSKDQEQKLSPDFTKALYVGSAYLFYTEYRAFKRQIDAINEGVKDNIRPERNTAEIIETVANDYFINHGINVDANYVITLANIAEENSPEDFLLKISANAKLLKYFNSLQR